MSDKVFKPPTSMTAPWPPPPYHPVEVAKAGKQLVTVHSSGEITYCDDLTLPEAKFVIQQLLIALMGDGK